MKKIWNAIWGFITGKKKEVPVIVEEKKEILQKPQSNEVKTPMPKKAIFFDDIVPPPVKLPPKKFERHMKRVPKKA